MCVIIYENVMACCYFIIRDLYEILKFCQTDCYLPAGMFFRCDYTTLNKFQTSFLMTSFYNRTQMSRVINLIFTCMRTLRTCCRSRWSKAQPSPTRHWPPERRPVRRPVRKQHRSHSRSRPNRRASSATCSRQAGDRTRRNPNRKTRDQLSTWWDRRLVSVVTSQSLWCVMLLKFAFNNCLFPKPCNAAVYLRIQKYALRNSTWLPVWHNGVLSHDMCEEVFCAIVLKLTANLCRSKWLRKIAI